MFIIEPKRNPVRIRIQSGGKEHSSLASLKFSFNVPDVKAALKSGALLKWLRQNGEMAEIYSSIQEVMENVNGCIEEISTLSIYKAFYPEAFSNMDMPTLAGLYHYWEGMPEYKLNLECMKNVVHEERELGKIFLNHKNKTDKYE